MGDKRIEYVSLDLLRFDPDNPRLPGELLGERDEAHVLEYMLRDASLIELMGSIGQSGYSASEPLLVCPGLDLGTFTVVEGNRRLAALKLLSNPELATVRQKSVQNIIDERPQKPTQIPVIKYESRSDILDYLGYRHITGVKSWGALEKARYLKQLYDRHDQGDPNETFKVLAKMIGSRSDYVGKLLASLNLFDYARENAFEEVSGNKVEQKFSLLSTAIGYESIYKYIGLENSGDLDSTHIKHDEFAYLFSQIYDQKNGIGESRNLSDFSKVIANGEALAKYQAGASLAEALYYTDEPPIIMFNFLNEAQNALRNANDVAVRYEGYYSNKQQCIDMLRQIEKTARGIRGTLSLDEA